MLKRLDFTGINVNQKPSTEKESIRSPSLKLDFSSIETTTKRTEQKSNQNNETVKKLDFSSITSDQTKNHRVVETKNVNNVTAAFKPSLAIDPIVDYVKKTFNIPSTDVNRIEIYIKQLVPLSVQSLIGYGDKVLQNSANITLEVNQAINKFTQSNVFTLIDNVNKALVDNPSFLNRLLSIDHVRQYAARLSAIRTKINQQVHEIDTLVNQTAKIKHDISIVATALFGTIQYVNNIDDKNIDLAANNKRNTVQQSLSLIENTFHSVDQLKKQIYSAKQTIDHFVDVTIPAYQATKARFR